MPCKLSNWQARFETERLRQRFTDGFDSGDNGLHFTIVMLISAYCFTPRMKFGSIPVQIGNTEAQLLGSESETDSSPSQDGKA